MGEQPAAAYPMASKHRRDAERSERDRIAEIHAQLRQDFIERVRAGRSPFPREAVA